MYRDLENSIDFLANLKYTIPNFAKKLFLFAVNFKFERCALFMRFLKSNFADGIFLMFSEKKLPTSDDSIHFHNFFEIEYVISGSGTYFIDGNEYEITPGKLCLVSPLNAHAFLSQDAELITLSFSDAFCDDSLLAQFNFVSEPIWISLDDCDRKFVETNVRELIAHKDDLSYVALILNVLITKIGKIHFQSSNAVSEFSPIRKSILYIATNFKKNITREEVAKHVGLTPSYFSALLKDEVGMSFKEYMDSLRFEHALLLLRYSDKTIRQICLESGFSNYENFIHRFTVRYGASPQKYRNTRL